MILTLGLGILPTRQSEFMTEGKNPKLAMKST